MTHNHPLFARFYTRCAASAERAGADKLRQEMLDGLQGRVIEIGCGHGLNFQHYPAGVTEVVAVEPEPYLRRLAGECAAKAPIPVTVVDGTAERLPAGDAAFDGAVASLVLCSVQDQAQALEEVQRVLRPGGELRFFEHVRAATPGMVRIQQALDRWLWPQLVGGCHCSRATDEAIRDAGFKVTRMRHFTFPSGWRLFPASPHMVGSARRLSG